MPQQLIILGASARAAAGSARRAGFEPFSIDLFADRDTAELGPTVRIDDYPGGFIAALAAAPIAPWIYTGSLENYPQLVDRLAQLRPLWGNGGAALARVRDPWQLAAVLHEANASFPEISADPPPASAGNSWIRKPLRSGGGMGIRLATDCEVADESHYFQRLIPGQSSSALFCAVDGHGTFLGASRQLTGRDWGLKNPFLYVGNIAPLDATDSEVAALMHLGQLLVASFGLVGLFGVDFIRAEDKIWVQEVNPRYTAAVEVVERATGIRTLHRPWSATAPTTATHSLGIRYHGKAVVYAPGEISMSVQWGDHVHALNESADWPIVTDLPRVGDVIERDKPICTLFAEAESPGEVENLLRERTRSLLKIASA